MTMAIDSNLDGHRMRVPKKGKQIARQEERAKDSRTAALDRCDDLIDWYKDNMFIQRRRMARSRLVAIVLSGLIPVLVIVQMSLQRTTIWWVGISILIALFPASAAIISGMNELFQYKENWIRFSETEEELKSEKARYLTRTTPPYDKRLDDYKALSHFVARVEAITLRETRKWRMQAEKSKELDELIKGMNQDVKN